LRSLVLISAWFGPWPEWIEFTLATCRGNPTVDWLIVTDQEPPENQPSNVRFERLSLTEFVQRLQGVTGVDLQRVKNPYKLCDLKPAFADALATEIGHYDNYGFADLDVIFGDIRRVYTDELLERYDALSTHEDRISGHLAVFRNTPAVRRSYLGIPGFRKLAGVPDYRGLDEAKYRRVFRSHSSRVLDFLLRRRFRSLFVERYSTVGRRGNWPDGSNRGPLEWCWRDGRLTAPGPGGDEYLYLHFMSWRSRPRPGKEVPPWLALDRPLVQVDWREAERDGFRLSPRGIEPIGDLG
jgi:hypothetical protein